MYNIETRPGSNRFERLYGDRLMGKILQGDIRRGARARRVEPGSLLEASREGAIQPLEDLFDPEYAGSLADRLLENVQEIFDPEPLHAEGISPRDVARGAAGGRFWLRAIDELEARVTDLSHWNWTRHPQLHLRLLFLSAWLLEIRDRHREAIAGYERYFKASMTYHRRDPLKPLIVHPKCPPGPLEHAGDDPQLAQLACNNWAVLVLRLGATAPVEQRRRAIDLLARLAVWDALPGACFSLSNVLDLDWTRQDGELELVDKALRENLDTLRILGETPPSPQQPQPTELQRAAYKLWKESTALQTVQKKLGSFTPWNGPRRDLILPLAMVAREIGHLKPEAPYTPAPLAPATTLAKGPANKRVPPSSQAAAPPAAATTPVEPTAPRLPIREQLLLWDLPKFLLWKAPPGPRGADPIVTRHRRYAEAVSLLYPRDIRVGSGRADSETASLDSSSTSSSSAGDQTDPARRADVSLQAAQQDAQEGRLDAAWERLDQESRKLVESLPPNHEIRGRFSLFVSKVLRRRAEEALRQPGASEARKWLNLAAGHLKTCPPYKGKPEQEALLRALQANIGGGK